MTFTPKFGGPPKSRLALLLEEEKRKKEEANNLALQKKTEVKKDEQWAAPEVMPERIRIVFDDSGSMGGSTQGTKLWDAKEGTVEFLKNCIPNQTAVSVHPLDYKVTDLSNLTTNLPALSVLVRGIPSGGSTPLFEILNRAQNLEPKATRFIVFSDGAPDLHDEMYYKDTVIKQAQEAKTPVDTVLIWASSRFSSSYTTKDDQEYMKASHEYKLLANLAEVTGGYFLVFDRNKMDFKTGLKYLAPKLRLMLMSEEVRKNLEEGKLK